MGPVRVLAVLAATIILLLIVLTVCFVFIGLYRMTEYNAMYSTVRAPRIKITDLYPHLKTGDILLFVSTTHSPSNSILTQTYHSHTGILLQEGELVYISEAQPALELMPDPYAPTTADFRMNHGADITPLLTRLKYYTGVCYVLRLSRPLDPGREERLKSDAERFYRDKYPYPTMAQIFLGILGRTTPSRHCFQHVAHLLDRARLTPLDRSAPLLSAGFVGVCQELCGLAGRPLPDGYSYEAPLRIVYDLGTVTLGGAEPAAPAHVKTEDEPWYGYATLGTHPTDNRDLDHVDPHNGNTT